MTDHRPCSCCRQPAEIVGKVYSNDARKVLCVSCAELGAKFTPTGLVLNGAGKVVGREVTR